MFVQEYDMAGPDSENTRLRTTAVQEGQAGLFVAVMLCVRLQDSPVYHCQYSCELVLAAQTLDVQLSTYSNRNESQKIAEFHCLDSSPDLPKHGRL